MGEDSAPSKGTVAGVFPNTAIGMVATVVVGGDVHAHLPSWRTSTACRPYDSPSSCAVRLMPA